MLRDGRAEVETAWTQEQPTARYRDIDRQLRTIARKKACLDVEEAKWLREAERHRIWRKLGFSTVLEYLEDVFGHSPRTAKDRLRVAKELGELPRLEAELRKGALPYSAARELSRVMTPATEAQWIARARGRNLRDIERLVAGHKKGDAPDAPKEPSLMTRTLVLELTTRQQALLHQVRAMFERERGEHVDDADLIEALCLRALEGDAPMRDDASQPANRSPRTTRKAPRPAHQIVIRKCECDRAWQKGKGTPIEIRPTNLALAECDAEVVREADIAAAQASGRRRPAPTATIPKKTRDLVWARDEGRCRFPGCRATRNLAIHHLRHRARASAREACAHVATDADIPTLVKKALALSRAGVQAITRGVLAEADAELQSMAKQALVQSGYTAAVAEKAVEAARANVGAEADLPTLLKEAFRRCRTT